MERSTPNGGFDYYPHHWARPPIVAVGRVADLPETAKMKVIILILAWPVLALTTIQAQQAVSSTAAASTKKVCVLGNVITSREIIFDKELTLTEALKLAGGTRPNIKTIDVVVWSPVFPEGKYRPIHLDIEAIEKHPYKDLDLHNFDVIEVRSRKKVILPVSPCPWVPFTKGM